jgi:hypothetical protein
MPGELAFDVGSPDVHDERIGDVSGEVEGRQRTALGVQLDPDRRMVA